MPHGWSEIDSPWVPIIKCNAKYGKWSIPADGDKPDIDIPNNVKFFALMTELMPVYLRLPAGKGTTVVWYAMFKNEDGEPCSFDGIRQKQPTMDNPRYEEDNTGNPLSKDTRKTVPIPEGFKLLIYCISQISTDGGDESAPEIVGLRRLRANSMAHMKAIKSAYNNWEKGKDDHEGSQPLFECSWQKSNNAYGAVYNPIFTIVDWKKQDEVPGFDLNGIQKWKDGMALDMQEGLGDIPTQSNDIPF